MPLARLTDRAVQQSPEMGDRIGTLAQAAGLGDVRIRVAHDNPALRLQLIVAPAVSRVIVANRVSAE